MSSEDSGRSTDNLPHSQALAGVTEEEERENIWGILWVLRRSGKLFAVEDWFNIVTLPRFF